MTEQEALSKMVAPGQPRDNKWRKGVIQIWVTRACDKVCFGCTQGSNLAGKTESMSPEHFEQAVESLRGYFGVVGVFGGNPAISPYFVEYCDILRRSLVPLEQRGLWCNNLITVEKARAARETFNPAYSNLNVHLDRKAYDLFRAEWPESHPFGLKDDSRHSPPFVAMRDVLRKECGTCGGSRMNGVYPCPTCAGMGEVYDEGRAWELISGCDINQRWSAMIGVFRGQLRAWFCEVAGAQSMLHQDEPDYPDTGDTLTPYRSGNGPAMVWKQWWQKPMGSFTNQVRKHCHDCGVPLRGYGELAQADVSAPGHLAVRGCEQTSVTHQAIYNPKRRDRPVQLVERLNQLETGRLKRVTDYLQNAGA